MDPTLTLIDRAAFYRQEFPQWPASWLTVRGGWISGYWVLGNNYRNLSRLYGAYPPGYLKRILALFPDAVSTLHLFSGSVERPKYRRGRWVSVDLVRDSLRCPTVQADAEALPFRSEVFDLVLADPPYTLTDARRYGVTMPLRRQVMAEVARIMMPGGYLVWLDCTVPMYRKIFWQRVGGIAIERSTNHRIRMVGLWQRTDERL